MQPGQMAYDRGITVFSPDGRLFQVEYAREAVKKGTTTIGIKFKDGVLLVVDKRVSSRLVEPESIEKIYDIDDYIGCATSGLVADARILVDQARKEAQVHKVNYGENIGVEMLTKKVCDYAHQFGVCVEGELGVLAGVEDEVASEVSHYTKPEEVIDFVTKTGVDSLAISIGTSHGAYKFKPEQCTVDPKTGRLVPPPLAFDVLHAIEEKLPGFPIVLHGSSSVPQEEVDIINANGGALKAAVGIPEEELREAAKSAVCKINIDSDSRLAMTAGIRKVFHDKPAEFDPRKYLGPARDRMTALYKHKVVNVLGSAGHAYDK